MAQTNYLNKSVEETRGVILSGRTAADSDPPRRKLLKTAKSFFKKVAIKSITVLWRQAEFFQNQIIAKNIQAFQWGS